jgi:hypothetical protein
MKLSLQVYPEFIEGHSYAVDNSSTTCHVKEKAISLINETAFFKLIHRFN